MQRIFLHSKIRDVRLTGLNLEYEGSVTVDAEYLELARILPDEQVQVLNVDNGVRLTTYAIAGERGSGIVELNGPAARHGAVGDRVMILTYAMLSPEEFARHKPMIISIGDRQGLSQGS